MWIGTMYFNKKTVDASYNLFEKEFLCVLDECCKMTKSKNVHGNNKPWLTPGIINACKKKNTLYKMWLSKKSNKSEAKYKRYKNKLVLIIRKAERDYYKNELKSIKMM